MEHIFFEVEGRRRFIKRASVFALTAAAFPAVPSCFGGGSAGRLFDSQRRPSRVSIADAREPGTRILIRGTVYDAGGRPAPGVRIFLYHTDAAGYYSRPVSDPRRSRLRGTVWSDAEGRYAFDTIKPAHYADVSTPPPMHIHVHLEPPNLPDHWVDSYYFEGDPHLRPEDIARASGTQRLSHVVRLAPAESGVPEGARDFRLDPAQAERNQLVNGWYRNP